MRDAQPQTIYLTDYREPDYWISNTELTFELQSKATLVTAELTVQRHAKASAQAPLVLDGYELELLSIALDGQPLTEQQYRVTADSLIIDQLPEVCVVTTQVRIYPDQNTALEGLYRSGGMYCTQCEAQGFRRITYYLDRPDVMAVFTTHIVADAEHYPVMLSNGNLLADHTERGLRRVTWHDPHKKPAYLFALVAGDLLVAEDCFTTMSGREVALKLYVEPQNVDKTEYALDALKRSMAWDETQYGREYDLDIFMIVAVDDFNMGAMENKGLNIFNSSCVLANPKTATDAAYQRIESIVAHEYFHNWSGNRVTCRDWFQLSLKEGFTVFRDSTFSADMNSAAVKRIEEVNLVRTAQFAEDASPMAHPVQPDSYMEISNFYTMTVYEKGAEVVRMMHTLVGAEGFRKGSDLYFQRHDGQAVTIHEFVGAMEEANQIDLTQFKLWYKQAGTPVVSVTTQYDAATECFSLELQQHLAATPGQDHKLPMWIPIKLGLLDQQGNELRLQPQPGTAFDANQQLVHLTQARQRFVFAGITERPYVSFLRNFSAPVKVQFEQTDAELLFLLAHDSDGFSRYEAGQKLMLSWLQQLQQGTFELTEQARQALIGLLEDPQLDAALVAYLLTLPSQAYLAELATEIDPQAIFSAHQQLEKHVAVSLHSAFKACYLRLHSSEPYQPTHQQMAPRKLKNLALKYWLLADPSALSAVQAQYQQADNMTDSMAALSILVNSEHQTEAAELLVDFYARWQHDALVINQWFAVQAGSQMLGSLEQVEALLEHPAFDWRNPNKIRSVLGVFAHQAVVHFHREDGAGYQLLADAIIRLNKANPQIAARLLTPLTSWQRYKPSLKRLMRQQLQRILAEDLSKDVFEVVSKSL